MGTVSSTDTRRISFDNTFALKTLAVQNSIEDENINDVLQIENLPSEVSNDIPFNEGCNPIDVQEGDSNTDYWSQRLEALKKEHQLINQIVESEYEKSAETAKKNYTIVRNTPEKVLKIKPCFDWRAKILQCYEDNPRQPLVCSNVVQAFSSYVASCRTAKD